MHFAQLREHIWERCVQLPPLRHKIELGIHGCIGSRHFLRKHECEGRAQYTRCDESHVPLLHASDDSEMENRLWNRLLTIGSPISAAGRSKPRSGMTTVSSRTLSVHAGGKHMNASKGMERCVNCTGLEGVIARIKFGIWSSNSMPPDSSIVSLEIGLFEAKKAAAVSTRQESDVRFGTMAGANRGQE